MSPCTILEWATNWYADNAREYIDYSLHLALQLLCCLAVTLLIYIIYVNCCLFQRFLRIRFGGKVQPDGTKAVIITGATSGFGLAIAKRLYKRGFTVFACYYNNQEAGYEELLELKRLETSRRQSKERSDNIPLNGKEAVHEPQLFLIEMDLRSSGSIDKSTQEIKHLLESNRLRLHCLLNNAGISVSGAFELIAYENIHNAMATNLVGHQQLTRQLVTLIIRDQGRVVNVSSPICMTPCQSMTLYGSSKAALSYFSDSLHKDLQVYGCGSYTIYPGNLTLQTNVVLGGIGRFQRAIARLSSEESQIYERKIESINRTSDSILTERFANADPGEAKRLAELYGVELPNFEAAAGSKPLEQLSFGQRLFFRLLLIWGGGSGGHVDLDENGATDCYESATVLMEPPRFTYAGSKLYQFYSGPMVEYIPGFVMNRFVNSLLDSIL